jgi:hypothetical protein
MAGGNSPAPAWIDLDVRSRICRNAAAVGSTAVCKSQFSAINRKQSQQRIKSEFLDTGYG